MNKNFLFPTSMTFLKQKCNYVYDHRAQRGGRPVLALFILLMCTPCPLYGVQITGGRGGTRTHKPLLTATD
ncbi:MAG: hypothetical protein UY39_C0037G0006 [Candidatus Kaiserbacteria bacterium GW2011_GWC2_49_12]|uniref:Uncharacterized protein n=1 Tax=Candidatus Kaiserbacteria bacterium GW2011_GWC2_49_12 TaxID=1618675 RepID=A0A0G1VIZ1_9BACT|nr:MAG: hypothetical protein UY39_C0037G0006 [Candidatus Kaiserbacteria bacterium GW2011_GWC2_49_12]